MNLKSKLFLDHLTDRSSDLFRECLEDLLFVVINSDMGGLQMLYVDQHLKWITQCHCEKV